MCIRDRYQEFPLRKMLNENTSELRKSLKNGDHERTRSSEHLNEHGLEVQRERPSYLLSNRASQLLRFEEDLRRIKIKASVYMCLSILLLMLGEAVSHFLLWAGEMVFDLAFCADVIVFVATTLLLWDLSRDQLALAWPCLHIAFTVLQVVVAILVAISYGLLSFFGSTSKREIFAAGIISGVYILRLLIAIPHVLCVDTCLLYTSPSPRDQA
eukprot:TRINITY_DN20082_c0_g2_i1.p1 TRINITY_DN20082_c0_g2~~TRINITY_DN20082_c0_g2_i1.p1  ORF type:complete len:233 (-),score=21.19 TRINITY_DN20082_c0_g2_i1:35-673(-)